MAATKSARAKLFMQNIPLNTKNSTRRLSTVIKEVTVNPHTNFSTGDPVQINPH